jgi:carboxymethylenebutenolidase
LVKLGVPNPATAYQVQAMTEFMSYHSAKTKRQSTMTQTIQINRPDGSHLTGALAMPIENPRGAVIIVQEIFGVNAHIRSVCALYAANGFAALAPAFFDRVAANTELGYTDADISQGRDLVGQIGFDNALRDVKAAEKYLREISKTRVAVIGYCWGGSVAMLCATRLGLPAVSYYGGRSLPFLHEKASAALQFHFGEHDSIISAADRDAIKQTHPTAEHFVYPAGHAFNRVGDANHYDQASAELAFARVLNFLQLQVR